MSEPQAERIKPTTWLALTSVSLGTFALVTTEFLPVGLLKEIASSLSISEGRAGLMVTMPGIVAAVSGPLLMLGAGKIDRQLGLWIMTMLLVISNAVSAISSNFEAMLASRVLLGLSVGGFWALAVSAAARMVPDAKMGIAISLILAGVPLGTVVGVPAGALIGDLVGWRWAFAINGALAFAILLAQVVFLPRLPASKSVRLEDMTGLFRRRAVLLGLAATAFLVTGHFAAYTFITPLLVDVSGFDTSEVTSLLVVYGIAAFAGNFAAGKLVVAYPKATLVGVSLLVAGTTVALPIVFANPGLSIGLVIIWGGAFGGLPVALQTWMYTASGDDKESGQVIFNSLFQWALAIGALVGGAVFDLHSVAAAIMMGGTLSLIAALIVLVGSRKRRQGVAGVV